MIETEVREVPEIVYETEYRDEDEILFRTEYETRVRDVPVERYAVAHHSHDSGDGMESDPEGHFGPHGHGHYGQGYQTADSSDDAHHYKVTDYVQEEY